MTSYRLLRTRLASYYYRFFLSLIRTRILIHNFVLLRLASNLTLRHKKILLSTASGSSRSRPAARTLRNGLRNRKRLCSKLSLSAFLTFQAIEERRTSSRRSRPITGNGQPTVRSSFKTVNSTNHFKSLLSTTGTIIAKDQLRIRRLPKQPLQQHSEISSKRNQRVYIVFSTLTLSVTTSTQL